MSQDLTQAPISTNASQSLEELKPDYDLLNGSKHPKGILTQDYDNLVKPSYRLLDKKIIFPDIQAFLWHWDNTFDFKFIKTTTKGGGIIYKLQITPKPSEDFLAEAYLKNIQYIAFAVEHHSIVHDVPDEYNKTGRLHFSVLPTYSDTSEIMKGCEKNWPRKNSITLPVS